MRLQSRNPALGIDTFREASYVGDANVMTIEGTSLKTGVLLVLCTVSAAYTWQMFESGHPNTQGFLIGGLIGGLVLALATCFKPTWAPVTAPLYALAEGLALGAISAMFNHLYDGIVFQAVCLTFGTLFAMLIVFQSGLIKVTEKFRAGMCAAIGAIFLVYVISWIMSAFGARMPFLHQATPVGIGISVVIVVIAALSLLLDFDNIQRGAEIGAPKYMEWYGAFGLMVSLVWLYIEILRLLAMIASSRD